MIGTSRKGLLWPGNEILSRSARKKIHEKQNRKRNWQTDWKKSKRQMSLIEQAASIRILRGSGLVPNHCRNNGMTSMRSPKQSNSITSIDNTSGAVWIRLTLFDGYGTSSSTNVSRDIRLKNILRKGEHHER